MLAGDLTQQHIGLVLELPNRKFPTNPFKGKLEAVTPIPHIGVTVALRDSNGWKIVRTIRRDTQLIISNSK